MTETKDPVEAKAPKADAKQKYVTRFIIYRGNGDYVKPKTILDLTESEADGFGEAVDLVVEDKPKKAAK